MTIKVDDPKLTAFVLGELTESEAKEVQAAINADTELKTEVEAIRQTVSQIETAMKNEPMPNETKILLPGEIDKPGERKKSFQPVLIKILVFVSIIGMLAGFLLPTVQPARESARESACKVTQDVANSQYANNRVEHESETIMGEWKYKTNALENEEALLPSEKSDEMSVSKQRDSTKLTVNGGDNGTIDMLSSDNIQADPSLPQLETKGKKQEAAPQDAITSPPPASPLISQVKQAYTPIGNPEVAARNPGVPSQPPSSPQAFAFRGESMGGGVATMGRHDDSTKDARTATARPSSVRADTANFKRGYSAPKNDTSEHERVSGEREIRDAFNSANDEAYKNFVENEFKPVKVGEFSTFSIDVDTAAYSTMRRYIYEMNRRPPVDSVRLEEYINYFKYDYAQPTDGKPFATHVDVSTCPWEPKHLLARIGIKGKEYSVDERPPLNLVFLIDVSGSMSSSNRLPLVQKSLTELVEMLQPKDRVAIVTYAGESRVALPSVSGQEKRAILDSINSLEAGGSTAGAAGIKTAYEVARKYFNKEAQNRVILCTDGDFNVGETNNKTLEEMIGDEAKSGVFLTILGFGMGNYKDDRLKSLSMRGNGNYGYIDTPEEARRLLVEGLTGTLFAIAKDVKIQVDFNPAKVAGYRLLGYENRKLRDEDFHNDKIDAGEIGAGHTVTALYEIIPVGENVPATIDKSRYAEPSTNAENAEVSVAAETPALPAHLKELMFVKLRYKLPDAEKSSLLEYPVGTEYEKKDTEMGADWKFSAAVALYGMLLRNSQHSGNGTFGSVLELAEPNTKDDQYRKEFIELVKKAKDLR